MIVPADRRRHSREAASGTSTAVGWWPESLQGDVAKRPEDLQDYRYVVVEEIRDRFVVLMAWPWPQADLLGRLFWATTDAPGPHTAIVPWELLDRQLYHREGMERGPRLGDVYAAERLGSGWDSKRAITNLLNLFPGRLFDISADAREAAKLAYQGAAAPVRSANRSEKNLLSEAARRRSELAAAPARSLDLPSVHGRQR